MVMGTGNPNAIIMIVGECFSQQEETLGDAFLGQAGEVLNKMLGEAGISRSECYLTTLCNSRPPMDDMGKWVAVGRKGIGPDHRELEGMWVMPQVRQGYERLLREVGWVKPTVIIAVGNLAMWALTGATGILKWRGSALKFARNGVITPGKTITVIPVLPPATVLYATENRVLIVNDFRRAKRHSLGTVKPLEWNFKVRPNFKTVMETLQELHSRVVVGAAWLDFDLETRAGHIACAGLSWSLNDAICIPFMCVDDRNGYWSLEEESAIVISLYRLLTHPNCWVRGQNLLYDCQYTYRHWHFVPNVKQDTMISHHTCFAGLPKSLAFQASLYCDNYLYWKDDGKTWTKDVGEEQLWSYNCEDCVRTRECGEVELANIKSMKLEEVEAFQQKLFWSVLKAMQKGVRIDLVEKARLSKVLDGEMISREQWFKSVLGHPLNPRSAKQMQQFFYDDLRNQPVMSKAKKGVKSHLTCDDNALTIIAKREPLMRPIIRRINEYRSLGVFKSTFVDAELDVDKRMRCSYNISGTETYRFNSSKNAFGSGTNLQNLPKGDDHDDPNRLKLPNVRTLFIPDEGYTFFDLDLDRADLQVVVWESGEKELKEALRKGVDMHLLNAFALNGKDVSLEDLVEGTEACKRLKNDFKKERQLAKAFIHGTNYGGGARTMAVAAGVTVAQAEKFQKLYFGKYPGIKRWHNRTEESLRRIHMVTNVLGYRRFYFESVEKLLPEALAWQPQSTVACVINRAWVAINETVPEVQVLLQVHDSLAGQFPSHLYDYCKGKMLEASKIVLPYPDPLIIPTGIKTSIKSWGDCSDD